MRAGVRWRSAAHRYNERGGAGQHMPPAAFRYAAHGVCSHRPVAEYCFSHIIPVDALGGAAPRKLLADWLFMPDWCRPDDWLSVAAGYQVQTFTDGWRSGVGGDALTPFDVVPKSAHKAGHWHELADGFHNLCHVRMIRRPAGAPAT